MNNVKIVISIIIVHYNVKNELFDCIRSVIMSKPKATYEIIVVDNDEKKVIVNELKKTFPNVIYVANPVNSGWGGGVNVGVRYAKGKFIYFLNPDTILINNVLDTSVAFFIANKKAGVVASYLLDKRKDPYTMQGTEELTPFKGVIVYSFINKVFPNNFVSHKFFYRTIERTNPFSVEIAPLTASMIRTDVFRKVGMFDPAIFLYFEEYDLQRRMNEVGYVNYILPEAKVIHFWESSTKQISNRNEILKKSRFYYFKKHFGLIKARIAELLLRREFKALMLK